MSEKNTELRGGEARLTRKAHNLEVDGSNPSPETKKDSSVLEDEAKTLDQLAGRAFGLKIASTEFEEKWVRLSFVEGLLADKDKEIQKLQEEIKKLLRERATLIVRLNEAHAQLSAVRDLEKTRPRLQQRNIPRKSDGSYDWESFCKKQELKLLLFDEWFVRLDKELAFTIRRSSGRR